MKYIKIFEEFTTSFIKTNNFTYGFKLSDINYLVKFIEKDEHTFEISYGSIDIDNLSIKFNRSNKGDVYRIISSVSDCVKDFVKENQEVTKLEFQGILDQDPVFKFIMKIYGRNIILDYLLLTLYDTFGHLSKTTRRTKVFSRWANREATNMSWEVKSQGNKIIMIKK